MDAAEYYNVIDRPEHEPLVKRLHAMLENDFGPPQKPSLTPKPSVSPSEKQEKKR